MISMHPMGPSTGLEFYLARNLYGVPLSRIDDSHKLHEIYIHNLANKIKIKNRIYNNSNTYVSIS